MEQNDLVLIEQGTESSDAKEYHTFFDTPDKIFSYGEEATKGISHFADEILSQLSLSFAEESSRLLAKLNHLMNRFDKVDFRPEAGGNFLTRLIQKARKSAGDLYDKYTAFSKEIDKIFVDVKKYELEIKDTNEMLNRMYEENMHFYRDLERYIEIAGSYIDETLNPIVTGLEEKIAEPENGISQIELGKFREIKDTLEQRIHDLELAKAVSLQTAPQIKLIQKGNHNLIRKINSAFVITMPLFKQGIIQAIAVKRQKLHMESMKALDESTNKLLTQNAHNIVENAKAAAQLGGTSSVRIESLEESYNTIINGIREVELIQSENRKQREESIRKLEEFKNALITGKPLRLSEDVKQDEAQVSDKSKPC